MAKRKSINKKLSRYNRSSIGSGFLDPNSEVLGEEESFWWNNLTNNANQSLIKYNAANQTSKYLDSDSQTELSDAINGWWNVLDSTDSEVSNNLHTVQKNKQPVPRTTNATMSDSDEDSLPLPQKKKITIRGKSRRSKSNPFLKAFNDAENSKLSKSVQDATVEKHINGASINNDSSKESDFKEDYKSKKDHINVTASTDQSHITDTILKSKPQVFRKRHERKKENVFENLLTSAEDKHNETDATEISPINSSNKLIERNKVSEENVSKRSITNSRISKHDGNHIYYKHSDSSFEIQSDHIDEVLQKESSVPKNRNQTVDSIYSSKVFNNSRVDNKTTVSPENNDKSETLFKCTSHIHTLNNSDINQNPMGSEINNSERSFSTIDQENMDKENLIQESNINNISQSLSMNKTLTNPVNTSLKRRKTDLKIDSTDIRTSFEPNSNTINNSTCNVTNNFAADCLTNDNKTNDTLKQMDTTNCHSTSTHTKDVIEYKSNNNEQVKPQFSTSLCERINTHSTDNLNEESFSKSNGGIQQEELDIDPSISKQKSKRATGRQSKTLIELQTDNLNEESFSKSNGGIQQEELDIGPSTSKQKSKRATGRQSKTLIELQTDNLNEESFSKSNGGIQQEELDIGPSTSKQKSKRATGRQSKTLIELQTDNLNEESFSKSNEGIQQEELDIGPSTSKQKSKRATSRQSKTLIELQTDNLNEESFSKSNGGIQQEELDIGPSTSKQKSKRATGRQSKTLIELQTDNLNEESFSKSNEGIQQEELDIGPSTSKQKSKRATSRQSKTLIELQTDNLNEESFSKSNGGIQQEELDMGPSASKEKPKGITNVVTNNNSHVVDENDQFCHKTMNATNFGRQKRINEYFGPTRLKLTSPTKVKKSKNIQLVKKTKEDEEIKKRLEQKKQQLDEYLRKTPLVTQLTEKELKERIKKLENEGKKKPPIKVEVHPAYLINGKRYKRPKLPRPQSWVTNRLYRHLWKVMEPKCKLLTRVESAKFVKLLSNSASIIMKSKKYEDYKDELDDLMNNMARLGVIHTRNDFYDFSYEFLPYDFRVKVIPMILPGNVKNIPYDPKKLHEPLLIE